MKTLSLAALVLCALAAVACDKTGDLEADKPAREIDVALALHKTGASLAFLDAGGVPGVDRFAYASGTAGTYTVPSGFYVTSVWAHNTSGGGTVTIAPSGSRMQTACAVSGSGGCRATGSAIVVPAGAAWSLAVPVLTGGQPAVDYPQELGEGTQFVFTSTDSYVVTLLQI